MTSDRLRRTRKLLVAGVFWLALIACAALLQRHFSEISGLFARLGVQGVCLVTALLALSWWALVTAWSRIVLLYSGEPLSLSRSARHLSLLLLGKYLPGGIWGFAARLADTPERQRMSALVVAGAFEQWIGLSTLAVMGSLGWLHASTGYPVLLLLPAVPYMAVAGWRLLAAATLRMRRLVPRRIPAASGNASVHSSRLIGPAILTAIHQGAQLGMVAALSGMGLGLSWGDAWLVSSLYGLATTVGILVVVVPGGIVVREGVFVALAADVLGGDQALAFAALVRLLLAGFDLWSAFAAGALRWAEERASLSER